MLSCEECKEISICDVVLALVWEFDLELAVRHLLAGVSSFPCYEGADGLFSVCVVGVVDGVVACLASGVCCDYRVFVEWGCLRGFELGRGQVDGVVVFCCCLLE